MAEVTSTYSDRFHNIENKIYLLVLNATKDLSSDNHNTFPGMRDRASIAAQMVVVFAPLHQAFVEDRIGRAEMIEWLNSLNATPLEIAEIIEMMEENKSLIYDARTRRLEAYKNRGTGE